MLTKEQLLQPLFVFVGLFMLFGVLLVFVQPPMAVNDEFAHFSRAYEISRGVLLTHRLTTTNKDNLGGPIPKVAVDLYSNNNNNGQKIIPSQLKAGIAVARATSINEKSQIIVQYSNTALYSPLTYIIQAVVIALSRGLDFSILTTLYLVRLAVVVSCCIVIALAIYITPIKKWFFATVGLLPMVMQESASASSDGLIIAGCLLFVACFLYLYHARRTKLAFGKYQISVLPLLFITILFASLAKPVYFPLFLTVFFLPGGVLGKTGKQKLKTLGVLLAIPFVLMTAWNIAIARQGDAQAQRLSVNSAGIYPPDAKTGVKNLLHPKYTVKLLVHTYVDQLAQKQVIPNYITQGFFGNFEASFIAPPVWYILTVGSSLALSAAMVDQTKILLSGRLRLCMLGALIISLIGITFSMFFYTTTNGQDYINGIQGRYFLPLLGFGLLLVGQRPVLIANKTLKSRLWLISLVIFNLLFMQLILWQWFWQS